MYRATRCAAARRCGSARTTRRRARPTRCRRAPRTRGGRSGAAPGSAAGAPVVEHGIVDDGARVAGVVARDGLRPRRHAEGGRWAAGGAHGDLDLVARARRRERGEVRRPHAVGPGRADVCGGVPAVEVADERDAERGGRPLAEVRAAAGRVVCRSGGGRRGRGSRGGWEVSGVAAVAAPTLMRVSSGSRLQLTVRRGCKCAMWLAGVAPAAPATTAPRRRPWREVELGRPTTRRRRRQNRAPQFLSAARRCRPTKAAGAPSKPALARPARARHLRLRRRHDGPPPHRELSRPCRPRPPHRRRRHPRPLRKTAASAAAAAPSITRSSPARSRTSPPTRSPARSTRTS